MSATGTVCIPRKKWCAWLWFVTHRQAAIACGRGHSLCTPETNYALAVVCEPSSVPVNITRPDWLNTHCHTPPALIMLKVSPPFYQRWNDAALFREMRETTSPLNNTREASTTISVRNTWSTDRPGRWTLRAGETKWKVSSPMVVQLIWSALPSPSKYFNFCQSRGTG